MCFFFQHATVFRRLIDENKHVTTESLFIPRVFKGVASLLVILAKCGLKFSSLSFAIRVNLLHPLSVWFILTSCIFVYPNKISDLKVSI